jgi:hypothetical protein
MRTSLVIAALIAAPVLLITACGADTHTRPVKGTVIEKEYEPAKTKKTNKPVKERVCTVKKGKRTCTTVTTGSITATATTKPECYELDIRADYTGKEIEVCDKAAYNALGAGDRYNSAVDYSRKKARR